VTELALYYVIRLNQGDYYQHRGGYYWGRSNKYTATRFDSPAEAQEEIRSVLRGGFGARVEAFDD
jgi:hypothetical protein